MIKFGRNAAHRDRRRLGSVLCRSASRRSLDGTWKPVDIWGGMKEGHVVMAPYTNMPDDVKKMAEETEAKIKGGWNPFTGPIAKQDGTELAAKDAVQGRRPEAADTLPGRCSA
jgi:basic membrane lipoprotein Med (substrate-binding protein (PBP1-ABC) superfamily)